MHGEHAEAPVTAPYALSQAVINIQKVCMSVDACVCACACVWARSSAVCMSAWCVRACCRLSVFAISTAVAPRAPYSPSLALLNHLMCAFTHNKSEGMLIAYLHGSKILNKCL